MLDNDSSEALTTARRALAILEKKAAGYGSLEIPPSLKIELEDKRKEVAELEVRYEKSTHQIIVDNRTPLAVQEFLKDMATLHKQIKEWKDLHDCLNDLVMKSAPFPLRVMKARQQYELEEEVDVDILQDYWYPIEYAVENLIAFARGIEFIGKKYREREIMDPAARSSHWEFEGEPWAVDIQAKKREIHSFLATFDVANLSILLTLVNTFKAVVDAQMYQVDKKLKGTADELYILSGRLRWSGDE